MRIASLTGQSRQLAEKLAGVITPRKRLITAYSGGVDSTLVAVMARLVLDKAHAPAVIGDSASLPRRELAEARAIAAAFDLEVIEVRPGEQDSEGYQANAGNRCYYCKTHLYDALYALAKELEIPFIANGTNTDDLGDHRPGLVAAEEAKVVSPLLEAGFGKEQVRVLARALDLPNWDKPAAACLASRVPYGTTVTPKVLAQIEAAEDALHELGFVGFRVRHHEQTARLELPLDQLPRLLESDLRLQVVERIKHAGYLFVTLDLEGFRSGSGNALLQLSTDSLRSAT